MKKLIPILLLLACPLMAKAADLNSETLNVRQAMAAARGASLDEVRADTDFRNSMWINTMFLKGGKFLSGWGEVSAENIRDALENVPGCQRDEINHPVIVSPRCIAKAYLSLEQ